MLQVSYRTSYKRNRQSFDVLVEQADRVPVVNPTNFKKYFTTAGLLEKELSEQILDTGSDITGFTKLSAKALSNYDKELRRTIGSMPLYGNGKEAYQAGYDDLIKYLEGDLDRATHAPTVQNLLKFQPTLEILYRHKSMIN